MVQYGLSPTAEAELTDEVRTRLERLWEWDLAAVARRTQSRMGWTRSRRRVVEREYRRFIALTILEPDQAFGMAGDVDELWHDHLLDTQNYLDMCLNVVGSFVHHCPAAALGAARKRDVGFAYEMRTVPALKKYYPGRVSPIWPRASKAQALAQCCKHISQDLAA
jgi:hypothetical protein